MYTKQDCLTGCPDTTDGQQWERFADKAGATGPSGPQAICGVGGCPLGALPQHQRSCTHQEAPTLRWSLRNDNSKLWATWIPGNKSHRSPPKELLISMNLGNSQSLDDFLTRNKTVWKEVGSPAAAQLQDWQLAVWAFRPANLLGLSETDLSCYQLCMGAKELAPSLLSSQLGGQASRKTNVIKTLPVLLHLYRLLQIWPTGIFRRKGFSWKTSSRAQFPVPSRNIYLQQTQPQTHLKAESECYWKGIPFSGFPHC